MQRFKIPSDKKQISNVSSHITQIISSIYFKFAFAFWIIFRLLNVFNDIKAHKAT